MMSSLNWLYAGVIFLAFIFILNRCNDPNNRKGDWPKYLGDSEMSHFSKLSQINKNNLNQLEVAWIYNTADSGDFQCNSIVINGILYGISAASNVFALDAKNGELLWRFTPSKIKHYLKNRGVAYWENDNDKRILCTYDEWLYALDANTGEPVSTFGDKGKVTLRSGLGANGLGKYLMSRTPGTVVGDLIIMPTIMRETPGAAPGFLQAFNILTGELQWVFHTIPLPGEYGFETWPSYVHEKGVVGGANNWSGISFDKQRGMIFVPTGSAGPDFFGGSRVGENLFANTIIAIDALTGKRIWHYKIVNHDIWDWDLPAPTNLATIFKNGKSIDVVAQITKSGHVFILNRETGEPIYPVEEIAVPPSSLEEESAWPTQLLPKLPLSFASQELLENHINKLSPDYDSLLIVFKNSKRGIFQPFSDTPTLINPGLTGGGEWGGAAVDPDGILYVNANEIPWIVTLKRNEQKSDSGIGKLTYSKNCGQCHGVDRLGNPSSGFPRLINIGEKYKANEIEEIVLKGKGMMPGFPEFSIVEKEELIRFLLNQKPKFRNQKEKPKLNDYSDPWDVKKLERFMDSDGNPGVSPPWGTLTAIDLNTGLHKWQVPLGENRYYKEKYGIITGMSNFGGPLITSSGLLFIAATTDSKIRAFDKNTGLKLWEDDLPVSGFSTPSTYRVDGVQYIVIACGGTKLGLQKGDSLIAYKLSNK